MSDKRLPIKLGREPLIDAIFELRFTSDIQGSNFLPGFLLTQLDPSMQIERLPAAEIPLPVRKADPNLRYQPLLRLRSNGLLVTVGDESFCVAHEVPPYRGWPKFKEDIIKVADIILKLNIIKSITRISLRYMDIIEGQTLEEQIKKIQMNISIGEHQLTKENFATRIEIKKSEILHVIQVAGPATAKSPTGIVRNGVLIDIDSILDRIILTSPDNPAQIGDFLESIHTASKQTFFDCITNEAIASLEPIYE